MSLRYDDVAEIIKIIDSSSCDEVIIETGDIKLVVRRNRAGSGPQNLTLGSEDAARLSKPAEPSRRGEPAKTQPRAAVEKTSDQLEVTAPMVGTFYRAPSPDAPPFVEIGSAVEVGQPLCIIEVMKLFTTIETELAGRVVQIGAQNGELVEFGQTLFVIEPT